jgi:putative holliday junction resolvase
MGRIMALDIGQHKTGIAVTDSLQIAAHGLRTIPTSELLEFLSDYTSGEAIEQILVGLPHHPDGTLSSNADFIQKIAKKIARKFGEIEIEFVDESYSSRDARAAILGSGAKRKKRRDKELVDKIAAVIILQRYLKHI